MIDPFLSQAWADRHSALSDFIADLLRQTRVAFERLAARTYDAPWARKAAAQREVCTRPSVSAASDLV